MKKLLIFTFSLIFLFTSCNKVKKEVVLTWPDGSPQLIYLVQGKNSKKVRVGELRYYENGVLQFEKHFSGESEIPCGIWHFYYDNGKLFAEGNFDVNSTWGGEWKFVKSDGEDYFGSAYDSVGVVEFGEIGNPSTVVYYNGNTHNIFQFYSNCATRSIGTTNGDIRVGKWTFFHPNGQIQTEATFVNGKEDGVYCVYRENGIPYYRGSYKEGKRIGIWEFYDEDATLVATKDYDKNE